MKTRRNISTTLKNSLFISPNPSRYKNEYLAMMDEIFPNKEEFILFLDSENYEKQLLHANNILLRLNYEAFFAPPTRMLFNLLNMETKDMGEKNSTYFGRDHVVHQVHLYIFGIYVFLYHDVFSENILVLFKNKRNSQDFEIETNNLSYASIKDFIVSWKTFTLFHDVGYPIELFAKEVKSKDDKALQEEYLRPFHSIIKYVSKDLSMRSLSKIIAVYRLLQNQSGFVFGSLKAKWIGDECKEYKDYVLIDKVYGIETVRIITAIFGKEKMLPVLCDKNEMALMAFPVGSKKPVLSEHCRRNAIVKNFEGNMQSPYKRESFTFSNYHWKYYLSPDEINIHKIISNLFLDASQLIDFENTINTIYAQTASLYSSVISDVSFKQYCFDIYMTLYRSSGYWKLDADDERSSFIYHLGHIMEEMQINFPEKIAQTIKKMMLERRQGNGVNTGIYDRVEYYLTNVGVSLKDLSNKITEQIKSEIIKQARFRENLEDLRCSVGEEIQENKIKSTFCFKEEIVTEKKKIETIQIKYSQLCFPDFSDTSELKTNIELLKSRVLSKITSSGLNNDAVANYDPGHGAKYDHGIAAGFLIMTVADIYMQLGNTKSPNTALVEGKGLECGDGFTNLKKLLNISMGIDYQSDYIKFAYKNMFVEACYAVLIHNIYPDRLGKKFSNFRTKLGKQPFAYFATLMDSLQFWDRKTNINMAERELPYATYAQNLNIEIKNSKIQISEADRRLNIAEVINKRKQDLDLYLESASRYIELNLSEF